MFRLISKTPYTKETLSKLDKYYRLMFNHDGSISRMIESLSGEQLIVNHLHHTSSTISAVKDETLANGLGIKDQQIEVRYVELMTKQLDTLLFAKSYWSKGAYNSIMAKNPTGSIGFNMINQELEHFRSINWIGEAKIKLEDDFDLAGLSRSYSIKSGGQIICEIEEYFTPQFNRLFY